MIRPYREKDEEAVVDIWLRASLRAHAFVGAKYWKARVNDMREIYLPLSEIAVDEEDGQVTGFMALVEGYLAALFVAPERQGRGIGSRLLRLAKKMRPELRLNVYADNGPALAFYRKHGFGVVAERVEEATGQKELVMAFPSPIPSESCERTLKRGDESEEESMPSLPRA